MPINPMTGFFSRIWSFVDHRNLGDEVTRSDLDAALDDFVPAINAALDGAISSRDLASFGGIGFDQLSLILTDTVLTYQTGVVGSVAPGMVVLARSEGLAFEVVSASALDYDITTAGDVRLIAAEQPSGRRYGLVFQSVEDLLDDESLSYDGGAYGPVAAGDIIRTQEDWAVYEVAGSAVTNNDAVTAGGVKLFDRGRFIRSRQAQGMQGPLSVRPATGGAAIYLTDTTSPSEMANGILSDGDALIVRAGDMTALRAEPGEGVRARSVATGGLAQIALSPLAWGCSTSATPAANDAAFAAMAAKVDGATIDLLGLSWPVTLPPAIKCRHGYWLQTNFDQSLPVHLPAPETEDVGGIIIDGGRSIICWAQDTLQSYNGAIIGGYSAAAVHDPGSLNWTVFWSPDKGRSIARFEPNTNFGVHGVGNAVFGACVVPPSTDGGVYDGAFHLAASLQTTPALNLYRRALSEYHQDAIIGGLDQDETAWSQVLFGGVSFGEAMQVSLNAKYSIATTDLPTVTHGLYLNGASAGAEGNVFFGFHGVDLTPPGAHLGYISNSPKSGTATLAWTANIGGEDEGVEPTAAWALNGGSAHLVGFIRSQGAGYPIRFWVASAVSESAVEAAVLQDCPGGNAFGTTSPIPCRMRPRRKGARSGWIATDETLGGSETDELHFAFTGTRSRDGLPGTVWLYRGVVTKGAGLWENMWARAKIIPVAPLYFANSNSISSTNQVGVPSLTFVDANTLIIAASTQNPAILGDTDDADLHIYRITMRDGYADAAEVRRWADGSAITMDVVFAPEFDAFTKRKVTLGRREAVTIVDGNIDVSSLGSNIVLIPETGTSDTLVTIRGGRDGETIRLRTNSTGNTITLTDSASGADTLSLPANVTLNNARDSITLIYDSGALQWVAQSPVADNA